MSSANDPTVPWTAKQGQYLAFLYAYTTIHGQAPAERDLERFFRTTPPSVHTLVKTLEREGFIARQAGVARSIKLLVSPEALPLLRPPE
jgi:DNA-binding MarR family transcriptional regulator